MTVISLAWSLLILEEVTVPYIIYADWKALDVIPHSKDMTELLRGINGFLMEIRQLSLDKEKVGTKSVNKISTETGNIMC